MYIVPFQWNWTLQSVGLTRDDCEQTVWAVSPDGRKYRGAAAISIVIDLLAGGPHVWCKIYSLPLIGRMQDGVYGIISRNRGKLPGATPAVDQSAPWKPQR